MNRIREALAEHDGELIGCLLPRPLWHLPVFFDIAQGQVEQLAGRVVAGEVATILDDLSKAHMQAFNGICGVDDGPYFRRISEERNDLLPLSPPHGRHGRELCSPWTFGKLIECCRCQIGVGGLIDRLQRKAGVRSAIWTRVDALSTAEAGSVRTKNVHPQRAKLPEPA